MKDNAWIGWAIKKEGGDLLKHDLGNRIPILFDHRGDAKKSCDESARERPVRVILHEDK